MVAMQRRKEINLIRLLATPLADTDLTVEPALFSSLRSSRSINIPSFSCKDVASWSPAKEISTSLCFNRNYKYRAQKQYKNQKKNITEESLLFFPP